MGLALKASNNAQKVLQDAKGDVKGVGDAAKDASPKIKNAGDETGKLGEHAEKSHGPLGALAGGLKNIATIAGGMVLGTAILKAPGFLMDAAKAAAEDEAATMRLNLALQNYAENVVGDSSATKELIDDMNERIAVGQKLAFSDDDVRDSMQALLAATGDYGEATKRSAAAMDLARGANIPLQTATKMLGKLNAENVEVFKKMGIVLGENATEADALAAVQQRFGGQAQEYAKSTAGQFEQAKLAFAETKEAIGGALLPILAELGGALATVLPIVQEMVGRFSEWASPIVAGAIGAIVSALTTLAQLAWDKFGGVLTALAQFAWEAIKDGAAAIADLAKWLGQIATMGASAALESIQRFLDSDAGQRLTAQLQGIRTAMSNTDSSTFADGWRKVSDAVKPALEFLRPMAEGVLDALRDQFVQVSGALKDLGAALAPLQPLLEPLAKAFGVVLVLAIAGLLQTLEGFIRTVTTVLVVAIEGLALTIRGLTTAFTEVTDFLTEWMPKLGSALGGVGEVFRSNISLIVGMFEPLMNIGAGIISGIVNGIEAGKDALMNAAKAAVGWIEDQIPDWIPHSPSRRGVTIGLGFMQGIAKGMEDGQPYVASAMAQIGAFSDVPDFVKRLSPAYGGSPKNAGPYVPFDTSWYIGGGQSVAGPGDASSIPLGSYIAGLGYKTANGWEQSIGAAASIDDAYRGGYYGSGNPGRATTFISISAVDAHSFRDMLARGGAEVVADEVERLARVG